MLLNLPVAAGTNERRISADYVCDSMEAARTYWTTSD